MRPGDYGRLSWVPEVDDGSDFAGGVVALQGQNSELADVGTK